MVAKIHYRFSLIHCPFYSKGMTMSGWKPTITLIHPSIRSIPDVHCPVCERTSMKRCVSPLQCFDRNGCYFEMRMRTNRVTAGCGVCTSRDQGAWCNDNCRMCYYCCWDECFSNSIDPDVITATLNNAYGKKSPMSGKILVERFTWHNVK